MFKLLAAQGPDFVETMPATDAHDMGLALRARASLMPPGAASDPLQQLAAAERADWALLRVLLCAALATVALALATMLG
jgi:hypothetical protein